MHRSAILLIVLLSLVIFTSQPAPVRVMAQGGSCSWSQTFDFETAGSLLGWATGYGVIGSSGVESVIYPVNTNITIISLGRTITFTGGSAITGFSIVYTQHNAGVSIPDAFVGGPDGGSADFGGEYTRRTYTQSVTWSSSGSYSIYIAQQYAGSGAYARLHSLAFTGTGVNPFTGAPCATADFTYAGTGSLLEIEFTDTSECTDSITAWAWDFTTNGSTDSTSQNPTYTFAAPGSYNTTLTITCGGTFSTNQIVIVVGNFTRPLAAEDEIDWYGWENVLTVDASEIDFYPVLGRYTPTRAGYSISAAAGNYVHAVAAGYVTSVRPLNYTDCYVAIRLAGDITDDNPIDPVCVAAVRAGTPPFDDAWVADSDVVTRFYLDTTDVYVVTISYDENTEMVYVARNSDFYLIEGDTVQAGCVLGETVALVSTPVNDPAFFNNVLNAGVGVGVGTIGLINPIAGIIAAGVAHLVGDISLPAQIPTTTSYGFTSVGWLEKGDQFELDTPFTAYVPANYPSNDHPCNTQDSYSDCQNTNPSFLSGGTGWNSSGGNGVDFLQPGALLEPNESVYLYLNLDPLTAYSVTFQAQSISNSANMVMSVRLGGITQAVTLDTTEWNSYTVDFDAGAPDAGIFHTLLLRNSGDTTLELRYACVTDGAPNLAPGSCYFNNPQFIYGTSGWTTGGTVYTSNGSLLLLDNATLAQTVTLLPDDTTPQDYTITVSWSYWYVSNPVGASASLSMTYGGSPISLDTGDVNYAGGRQTSTATITVSSSTTAAMQFTFDVTPASSDVVGTQVYSICLTPEGRTTFPGQGGLPPPPFTADCKRVSRPVTNDPAQWTEWLWLNFDQFFNCYLMKIMGHMYDTERSIENTIRWSLLYSQYYNSAAWQWLNASFFPYLSGHFANIAQGRTTIIQNNTESCNNLFCTLDALISGLFNQVLGPLVQSIQEIITTLLALLSQVVGVALSLVVSIFTLLFNVIQRLFGFFSIVIQYALALFSGISSAQPAAIAGLPRCDLNPQSNILCVPGWILENTIFAGNGKLLLAILIGYLVWEVIEDLIETISEKIGEMTGNL